MRTAATFSLLLLVFVGCADECRDSLVVTYVWSDDTLSSAQLLAVELTFDSSDGSYTVYCEGPVIDRIDEDQVDCDRDDAVAGTQFIKNQFLNAVVVRDRGMPSEVATKMFADGEVVFEGSMQTSRTVYGGYGEDSWLGEGEGCVERRAKFYEPTFE